MNIKDIKKFGVYAYNDESGQKTFVEVLEVYTNERKAKVSLCKSFGNEIIEILTEKLSPISITEPILKALSFEEITGQLYGFPNEHFFRLKTDNGIIEIIREKGTTKRVQPNKDNWYGCKFISIQYLHQLQHMLGRIDLKEFSEKLLMVK